MEFKDQKKQKVSNCWDCGFRKKGGINAFGVCVWWDKPKEIPSNIVDKGCKLWRYELTQKIIDRFDGILING